MGSPVRKLWSTSGLRDTFAGDAAARPTSHWLTRLYIQGTAALACAYYPETIPEGLISEGRVPFAAGPAIDPIPQTDPRAAECNQTLHIDFENYTLGRLVEDRQNYDMEHPGHQQVVAHVRGTVWELGWRKETFGPIDDEIQRAGRPWLSDSTERSTATERYGKKYGWVGYYTAAGQLDDRGELTPRSERLADVDIDPSFPDPPEPAPIQLPDWARPTPADTKRWIRQGIVKVPDDLLYRAGAPPDPHRWAAVYGYLEAANQAPGRRVWGFLTAVLVADQDADRLETALRQRSYPSRRLLPEPPEDHYTFAGEIPWHPHFAHHDEYDEPFYSGQVHVDGEPPIDGEILAHWFGWESYHSPLNQAGNTLVPSRDFSDALQLRGLPQVFHQAEPDGSPAALSYAAPPRFNGKLLYLREDLLARYAQGRTLIWFLWGERQLRPYPSPAPQWLVHAQRSDAEVWRHIARHQWSQ